MTTQTIPSTKHELALWLCHVLGDQSKLGAINVGTLPEVHDFGSVEATLKAFDFAGVCDEQARRIEFYPSWAGLYPDIAAMLEDSSNLEKVPQKFTLQDLAYTYPSNAGEVVPVAVERYLDCTRFLSLLKSMADLASDASQRMVFLQRHDEKLTISIEYSEGDLVSLPDLNEFAATYVETDHHKDQKRTIVRSALIDLFKGKKQVAFVDLLRQFNDFMDRVRSSYAMYVAEFSFEKIKAEVEKDNLDSAVKLQKTVSDIQNQLLAIPLTLLFASGQMTTESSFSIKNFIIWIGCLVFGCITLVLISNQRHTVKAVKREVEMRKAKVDSLPVDTRDRFSASFSELNVRVDYQDSSLKRFNYLVVVWIICATALYIWHTLPAMWDVLPFLNCFTYA